jgi:hypothetical protein
VKLLRSTNQADAYREVRAAYQNRINQMAEHGEDSPEGLLAEATADAKAAEYDETYGS